MSILSCGFFCTDSKSSLGGTLCLVVQVVGLSEVSTTGDEIASDVPSGVVFSSWLGTSTERERERERAQFIYLSHSYTAI